EVPTFVPARTILPGQRDVRRLGTASYPNLVVDAYPGADGTYELYEDDGLSTGYQRDQSVRLPLDQKVRARRRTVTIGPARGSYRGWLRRREVEVRFVAEAPPRAVSVDGSDLPWSPQRREGHWCYDTSNATVVVSLPRVDLRDTTTVVVDRATPKARSEAEPLIDGYPGLARRIAAISDATRALVGDENRHIMHLAQTPDRIARDPSSLVAELREIHERLGDIDDLLARASAHHTELESLNPLDPPRATEALAATRRLLATTLTQFGA
ncbi:MAG TPA: DUF5110 domain-containing protein, partial [Acidimicrobiales bacterium]|nr:DUF5110 domain-containing protein [Acidimicrobiales bacterium]